MKRLLQKRFILLFTGGLLGIFFLQRFPSWQTEMTDWLKRQSVRRSSLNNSCLNESLSSSKWRLKHEVSSQIFVVESQKVLYCEVPKVGCSNWKKILLLLTLNLSREPLEVNQDMVHQTDLLKRLSTYTSERQLELLNNYTKVMITRHPLERLVSAYRDKLLHSEPYYSISLANEIKALFRKNKNSTGKVTFQEFVSFVVSGKLKHMDIHWRPMSELCDPCNVHYNFWGRFETLEEDAKNILRQIGAPDGLHYPNAKFYSSEKRTSTNITWTHLKKLSWSQMQKLKVLYHTDFSLFNYSFNFENETWP